MDGLEISRTLETGRAQTRAAEQTMADRQEKIMGIADQRDRDLKNASDKVEGDKRGDYESGAVTGGDTLYRLATSGVQVASDLKKADGVVDFVKREYSRSLGKTIVGGVKRTVRAAGSGAKSLGGALAEAGRGGELSDVASGGRAGAKQVLGTVVPGGGSRDLVTPAERIQGLDELPQSAGLEEPTQDDVNRARMRSERVGQAKGATPDGADRPLGAPGNDGRPNPQRLSYVSDEEDTGPLPSDQADTFKDIQTQSNAVKQLNQTRENLDGVGRQQQNATRIASRNAPTKTKTFQIADPIPDDVVASNPDTLKATKIAAAAEEARPKTALEKAARLGEKGSELLNNPFVKTGAKVYGNLEGGEDIYDAFAHKDVFDPKKGAGHDWTYASHLLGAAGTVSDVLGTVIPGLEEFGAVLNIAGTVAGDIGTHEKDVASASSVSTTADTKINQINNAPIQIAPSLSSAGLIASASRHAVINGTSSTF